MITKIQRPQLYAFSESTIEMNEDGKKCFKHKVIKRLYGNCGRLLNMSTVKLGSTTYTNIQLIK